MLINDYKSKLSTDFFIDLRDLTVKRILFDLKINSPEKEKEEKRKEKKEREKEREKERKKERKKERNKERKKKRKEKIQVD